MQLHSVPSHWVRHPTPLHWVQQTFLLLYTGVNHNMLITAISWYVIFASYNLHCHCNTCMSSEYRRSPLKALLNTYGTPHKTQCIATRCKSPDIENIPTTEDSSPLDLVPQEFPMPEGDNDSSDEYSEKKSDTCHSLARLLEQFHQLRDLTASLKSTALQSTPIADLLQFTDKLQSQSTEEAVHKTMQAYTDTLHATQRKSNLTTTMLQDIPTFDSQDSSKLEDWFMNIETTADILTENHTCLAEAKSCALTCTLICKATQTGKGWDDIEGILRLKLCNANIHTYTSHFMEIQQKDNEALAAYIHHFKTAANPSTFDNDTVAICIFAKKLQDAPLLHLKYMRTPQLWLESSDLLRNSVQNTNWQLH